MGEPLLTVRGLSSGYGDVQVLWGVDLEVERGRIVCLIGSNGAGKSTLLRTISGLIAPKAGSVHFQGDSTAAPHRVLGGLACAGRTPALHGPHVRDNPCSRCCAATGGPPSSAIGRDLTPFPILNERCHQTPRRCPAASSR